MYLQIVIKFLFCVFHDLVESQQFFTVTLIRHNTDIASAENIIQVHLFNFGVFSCIDFNFVWKSSLSKKPTSDMGDNVAFQKEDTYRKYKPQNIHSGDEVHVEFN